MQQAYWKITDIDGEEIELGLTYHGLYLLREGGEKTRSIYEAYQRIAMAGPKDELEQVYIIYTAYCCAHPGEDPCDFADFLRRLPPDRSLISTTVSALWEPSKKKRALQMLLGAQQNAAAEG